MHEPAARRELEAAITGALWRYAEAVTGLRHDGSGEPVEGSSFSLQQMHMARLPAARHAREVLRAAEAGAAADAIKYGTTYPMLAEAAGIAPRPCRCTPARAATPCRQAGGGHLRPRGRGAARCRRRGGTRRAG